MIASENIQPLIVNSNPHQTNSIKRTHTSLPSLPWRIKNMNCDPLNHKLLLGYVSFFLLQFSQCRPEADSRSAPEVNKQRIITQGGRWYHCVWKIWTLIIAESSQRVKQITQNKAQTRGEFHHRCFFWFLQIYTWACMCVSMCVAVCGYMLCSLTDGACCIARLIRLRIEWQQCQVGVASTSGCLSRCQ